ncbi:hypothetical protein SMICM17S_12832 [Streptomyces microflavus]
MSHDVRWNFPLSPADCSNNAPAHASWPGADASAPPADVPEEAA